MHTKMHFLRYDKVFIYRQFTYQGLIIKCHHIYYKWCFKIFISMQHWDNQNDVPHFHHDVTKKYAKMNFRIVMYFNCRKITEGK